MYVIEWSLVKFVRAIHNNTANYINTETVITPFVSVGGVPCSEPVILIHSKFYNLNKLNYINVFRFSNPFKNLVNCKKKSKIFV